MCAAELMLIAYTVIISPTVSVGQECHARSDRRHHATKARRAPRCRSRLRVHSELSRCARKLGSRCVAFAFRHVTSRHRAITG